MDYIFTDFTMRRLWQLFRDISQFEGPVFQQLSPHDRQLVGCKKLQLLCLAEMLPAFSILGKKDQFPWFFFISKMSIWIYFPSSKWLIPSEDFCGCLAEAEWYLYIQECATNLAYWNLSFMIGPLTIVLLVHICRLFCLHITLVFVSYDLFYHFFLN